jgi:chemotaxis protein MotA
MIAIADRLFDPLALFLVIGGTMAATILASTRDDLGRALRSLLPLVRANPRRDAIAAANAVRQIRHISEYKGRVGADRVKTPIDYVHRLARALADAPCAESFASRAREDLDERRNRHQAVAGVWRTAADSAPAMGMIGTVVGLSAMFADMGDAAAMGPAMAAAMLTTLYGLLIAAILATPVAARLDRLSQLEYRWREKTIEALAALARAEEQAAQSWGRRRRAAGAA